MTWNAAFPSSPLSRSALRGDTSLGGTSNSITASDPDSLYRQRSYAHLAPPFRYDSASSLSTTPPLRYHAFPHAHSSGLAQSPSPSLSSAPSLSPSPSKSASPHLPPRSFSSSSSPRSTRRISSSHLSTSPTPNNLALIGSYSESLLSGRMSTTPSIPFPFQAQLGVLGARTEGGYGHIHMPRHINIDFEARFYAVPDGHQSASTSVSASPSTSARTSPGFRSVSGSLLSSPSLPASATTGSGFRSASGSFLASPSLPTHTPPPAHNLSAAPYVGTIDVEGHYHDVLDASLSAPSMPPLPPVFPGYAVPSHGHIQLLIKNPELDTPVKLFLVPYDLRDMPPDTKTFVRQKICVQQRVPSMARGTAPRKRLSLDGQRVQAAYSQPQTKYKETLKYAVHLHFAAVSEASIRPRKRRGGEATSVHTHDGDAPTIQYFLYKSIRVVFSPRAPERDDVIRTYVETPAGEVERSGPGQEHATHAPSSSEKERDKKYATFAGRSAEWTALRKRILKVRKECKAARADEAQAQADAKAMLKWEMNAREGVGSDMQSELHHRSRDETLNCDHFDGVQAHAHTLEVPRSEGSAVVPFAFAPNSDPDGERWAGSDTGGDGTGAAHPAPVPTATSPPPPQPRALPRLRRQRSRTLTPTPSNTRVDTVSASASSSSAARSLPQFAPTHDDDRAASPAMRSPSPPMSSTPGTSRPSSPFPSALALSLTSASPAQISTTRDNVSGETAAAQGQHADSSTRQRSASAAGYARLRRLRSESDGAATRSGSPSPQPQPQPQSASTSIAASSTMEEAEASRAAATAHPHPTAPTLPRRTSAHAIASINAGMSTAMGMSRTSSGTTSALSPPPPQARPIPSALPMPSRPALHRAKTAQPSASSRVPSPTPYSKPPSIAFGSEAGSALSASTHDHGHGHAYVPTLAVAPTPPPPFAPDLSAGLGLARDEADADSQALLSAWYSSLSLRRPGHSSSSSSGGGGGGASASDRGALAMGIGFHPGVGAGAGAHRRRASNGSGSGSGGSSHGHGSGSGRSRRSSRSGSSGLGHGQGSRPHSPLTPLLPTAGAGAGASMGEQ